MMKNIILAGLSALALSTVTSPVMALQPSVHSAQATPSTADKQFVDPQDDREYQEMLAELDQMFEKHRQTMMTEMNARMDAMHEEMVKMLNERFQAAREQRLNR